MCFSVNPLSSTIFSHVWNILVVYSMLSLSMSDYLNNFPKHLIGFPTVDRIYWICILTSLLTRPLIQDIFGLNFTHTRQGNYLPTLKGPILLVYMSWCCHCEIIHEVSDWWLMDLRVHHWQNPHSHYKQDRGDGTSSEYPLLYSLPEMWWNRQHWTESVFPR